MTRRGTTVRVEYDGDGDRHTVCDQRVVDLRDADVGCEQARRAIYEGAVDGLEVDCPDPRPVHEHVGVVSRDVTVAVRPALAAAARSRGMTAPQDDDLAAVRERLADLSLPDVDPDPAVARRRLAGTESTVERQRERVATLRGRIQAAREAGREVDDLQAELADATRELSEAETERAAAREALDRAERLAREVRDAREERRRLQDRAGNLERAARDHLVDRVHGEYVAAVADLCGDGPDPFDVADDEAALAVGRVADLRAPVVLTCDRLSLTEAAWLDAPVIRVQG